MGQVCVDSIIYTVEVLFKKIFFAYLFIIYLSEKGSVEKNVPVANFCVVTLKSL